MKKIIASICLCLLLASCDDGDITIATINLDDVQPEKCTDVNSRILYKISNNQALLFELGTTDYNRAFANQITNDANPIIFAVMDNSTNKMLFRTYNGTVASNNICGSLLASTPSVSEEWPVVAGTAEITTTVIKTLNETDGSSRITKYKHAIVFKNISFQKPDGSQQQYSNYPFGNYLTLATSLPFGFQENGLVRSTCTSANDLLNIRTNEVLHLKLKDAVTYNNIIQNSATPSNTPRTLLLDADNKLTYTLFNSAVTNDYYCATTTPSTPILNEKWEATGGSIEVTSVDVGAGSFKHTVMLKNVTLAKDGVDFNLGTSYNMGSFTTP